MASIEQGQSNTIERSSSFKRRQNTALASGIAYLIPSAFALFIGIRILASGEGEQVFAAIFCIAVAMWLISMACGVLWCDIEDLGRSLSVKFGPFTPIFCGFGAVEIAYSDIKSYGDPAGSCEGLFAYGLCRINICANLRQHSLCSSGCGHRQVVIRFKTDQAMCGKAYDKITISVNESDYGAFSRMMNEKLGNSADNTVAI